MKQITILAILAVSLALPISAAQAQTVVLDESFGIPDTASPQPCPALPAGWAQFNADGNATGPVIGIAAWPWPAGNPGWVNWPMGYQQSPAWPVNAESCAPMSSAWLSTPGQAADRWLATPAVTVPAGAKLRFVTKGVDRYEVRWSSVATSPAAMLADADAAVLLSVPTDERGERLATREIDLAALAGKTGHITFRNTDTDGFWLSVQNVWVGVPAANEYPITATVTPADGSGGVLSCPSGAAPGGTASCTAFANPGYTFHHAQGIGGCNQPGDVLGPNNDRCAMGNVQGPRTLTATFVPYMPPPTNITATPDGAGNVTIGWTPPDTPLPIGHYDISLVPLPIDPMGALGATCPNPTPGTNDITSCTVAGYQTGTAYVLNLRVADEHQWGFAGHAVDLGRHALVQLSTVNLPSGGTATLLSSASPMPAFSSGSGLPAGCTVGGLPAVQTPGTAALAGAGAPAGSTAPLGALQLNLSGCEGQTVQLDITYPAGALAGKQAWVQNGPGWQQQGSIVGDTLRYQFTSAAGGGAITATVAPLDVSPPTTYTIGGTVAGLTGTGLVLRNNGGGDRGITSAGPFTFAVLVAQGGAYDVTVHAQPVGQTCTVANGSGTASANVTNVLVNCTDNTYAITTLPVGYFTCTSTSVTHGGMATCNVTPPAGQATQSISGCYGTATGPGVNTYTAGPVTGACTITATFAPLPAYTIGGTVNGLTGTGLVLRNGSDGLPVTANGPFTFPTAVTHGGGYAVTVQAQPTGQRCTVGNASGSNVTASVGNVQVACAPYFEGTTVPASGAGGTGSATFTGGGPACRFDLGATGFEAAPATPLPGRTLPQGVLRVKLVGCTAAVAMEVTWPEPVAGYTKHGLAASGDTQPSYFAPADLAISGRTVRFTLTDGQQGDDDWTPNGEIADPSGPTALAGGPGGAQPIPTLGEWGVALLSALLGLLALRRRAGRV